MGILKFNRGIITVKRVAINRKNYLLGCAGRVSNNEEGMAVKVTRNSDGDKKFS